MRTRIMATLILGVMSSAVAIATLRAPDNTRSKPGCREGTVCEGFQLSTRVERETIHPGEPIVLTLLLKNTTKGRLYLSSSGPEKDFLIVVRRADGQTVQVTEYGRNLLLNRGVIYARFSVKADPGEVLKYDLELNKQYDLSSGGTFFVTVRRDIRTRNRKAMTQVASNTIRIVVK